MLLTRIRRNTLKIMRESNHQCLIRKMWQVRQIYLELAFPTGARKTSTNLFELVKILDVITTVVY